MFGALEVVREPHFEKPRVTPMLGFTEFEAQKKSGDKSWWNTHVTIRETSNRH